MGCHSPCSVLTGHTPARTNPSPSKDLFLHHLHSKVQSKLQWMQSLPFKVIGMSKGYFPKMGARKYTCTPIRDLSVVDMTFKCHVQELDSCGLIRHKFTQDFEKICLNPVSPLNLVSTAQYFQLSNTRPTAGVSHILRARLC